MAGQGTDDLARACVKGGQHALDGSAREPPHIAATIADVTHATFVSGMTASFLLASIVAIGGALVALLVKKGHAVSH
ncbi:MAG: hypothetical protein ACRDNW_04970 [Trebonia sp.]